MENSSKITSWIIENKNQFNIIVTEITGLTKYFPKLFDFKIQLTFQTKLYLGRGTDEDEGTAISKAFSECIERIAVNHYNFDTSSGLAGHFTIKNAKKNAMFELIEHDAYLCNFLLKNKLRKISGLNTPIIPNITIELFELLKHPMGCGILCISYSNISNQSIGLNSGTSFKENLDQAIKHAIYENIRALDYKIDSNVVSHLSLNDFMALDNASFKDHQLLSSDPLYKKLYFESLNSDFDLNLTYNEDDFSYQNIDLSFLSENIPIKIVRALNSNLQQMFTGPTTSGKINENRLREVLPTYEFKKINKLPHPFD